MTSQTENENKKVTLYLIAEDSKETAKKIKENAINLLNNRPIHDEELRSLPLFPSYRGSLIDASEKVTYEHRKWLRLVFKVPLKDVSYPTYQFEKGSDVPFYLLDAYEEAFEEAAKKSENPPKYIENGIELGSILKVKYLDGENKRFSFLYKDKDSDMKFLSPVYSLNDKGEKLTKVVNWFLKENEAFRTHYNKNIKRTLERKPSEIIDATNPNIVTVVNPATVSVVCTSRTAWPILTHVTRINNGMLPVRSDYKYFLKQDITNPTSFNELKTPQGRSLVGWKYTIQGATTNVPSLKKKHEKVKINTLKSKSSLWRWLVGKVKKERTK